MMERATRKRKRVDDLKSQTLPKNKDKGQILKKMKRNSWRLEERTEKESG